MSLVYIVDDDVNILESLESILSKEGYTVKTAESPEKFYQLFDHEAPAVAVFDIFFGEEEETGDALVEYVKSHDSTVQCIVISGESNIQKTVQCLKKGALDFLEKPVSLPRLLTSVKNAVALYNVKNSAQSKYAIIGKSAGIKNVISRIQKLSGIQDSVLICGENGTGKELVAQNLHLLSERYALTLYKVNCAALNQNLIESELFGHTAGSFTGATREKKGYFEIASQSTLFIDEIGDFDITLQSILLRVLQEKTITPVGSTKEVAVNTRLLFATHRNLGEMIAQKIFREDLYYRISTFTIEIPPLRERLEDIDLLAKKFLQEFIAENNLSYKEFSNDAIIKLKEYHYPGNIRELNKIVKNAAFFCEGDVVTPENIDFNADTNKDDIWFKTRFLNLNESKDVFEKEIIMRRLKNMQNDITKTAESFGILKNNFYRKMKELNIHI